MYAGTTLNNKSGSLVGAHQNINRVAYRRLQKSMKMKNFPELSQILHFEGNNGPDGIKRKSPSKDEPLHFCNPHDPKDQHMHNEIQQHYDNLVQSLRAKNMEKAAFEASWLAHAVVDGLTPAHHFPYMDRVTELRGGKDTFDNLFEKLVFIRPSFTQTAINNWKFWGARGILISHSLFEWGVASMALIRSRTQPITKLELSEKSQLSASEHYDKTLKSIHSYKMFDQYHKTGWSFNLAKQVNDILLPQIVEAVSMMWAGALHESGMSGKVYA